MVTSDWRLVDLDPEQASTEIPQEAAAEARPGAADRQAAPEPAGEAAGQANEVGGEASGGAGGEASGEASGGVDGRVGPVPVNGLGVADWLVEPLLEAAIAGLESMSRTDVPPRLVPLVGRRHPRLSRSNRELIAAALGQHRKFTEAVYDRLFTTLELQAALIEERDAAAVIALLGENTLDAPEAVSLLFAADRAGDAARVAEWAMTKSAGSDTLTGIIEALSRENAAAEERLRRLDQELAAERRARRALERRIEKAAASAESAREQAMKAEAKAGWTRVEKNAEATRAAELERQVAELESAVESGRRERRDLLAELRDLHRRYRWVRRELKEVRAKLPAVDEPARLELRAPQAAPTTAELRDRFVQSGAKGVLEAKQLLLLVDGWNVGLGHVSAEKLEDKRRVLEQALERYKSRTGNQVMVVYDGRTVSWFWMPRVAGHTIARVFTEDETADDFIVGELEVMAGSAETPVVVTSDRELRRRCIAQGAFVVSSESLASLLGL
jgi:predicted RNA-binding protein with PIN domain